jgi:hypothetical protein
MVIRQVGAQCTNRELHQRESRMGGLRLVSALYDCSERGALAGCARLVAERRRIAAATPDRGIRLGTVLLSRFVDTCSESFNLRHARFGHLRLLGHIGHQPDASPSG